jgi:hypothetical protein
MAVASYLITGLRALLTVIHKSSPSPSNVRAGSPKNVARGWSHLPSATGSGIVDTAVRSSSSNRFPVLVGVVMTTVASGDTLDEGKEPDGSGGRAGVEGGRGTACLKNPFRFSWVHWPHHDGILEACLTCFLLPECASQLALPLNPILMSSLQTSQNRVLVLSNGFSFTLQGKSRSMSLHERSYHSQFSSFSSSRDTCRRSESCGTDF